MASIIVPGEGMLNLIPWVCRECGLVLFTVNRLAPLHPPHGSAALDQADWD